LTKTKPDGSTRSFRCSYTVKFSLIIPIGEHQVPWRAMGAGWVSLQDWSDQFPQLDRQEVTGRSEIPDALMEELSQRCSLDDLVKGWLKMQRSEDIPLVSSTVAMVPKGRSIFVSFDSEDFSLPEALTLDDLTAEWVHSLVLGDYRKQPMQIKLSIDATRGEAIKNEV
jgi:hypothetical protein